MPRKKLLLLLLLLLMRISRLDRQKDHPRIRISATLTSSPKVSRACWKRMMTAYSPTSCLYKFEVRLRMCVKSGQTSWIASRRIKRRWNKHTMVIQEDTRLLSDMGVLTIFYQICNDNLQRVNWVHHRTRING